MREETATRHVNVLHVNVIIWQGDTRLPHSRGLGCGGKAGDVPPGVESLAHLSAVREGRQPMPPVRGYVQ